MTQLNTDTKRIIARDSRFQLFRDALGRRHYKRRQALMQAADNPRFAVIPDDEIGIEILQYGLYERRLLEMLFGDVLSAYRQDFAGKVALDIGANIGNHSVFFSSRFKRVVAFEPGSVAQHLLRANLLLNKIDNVDFHQTGLSDRDGQASLAPSEANNIGSNSISAATASVEGEVIALRRGDGLLESLPDLEPIALVKIDVEGHEIEALRGLEAMLTQQLPIILFETSGNEGPSGSKAVLSLLRSFGYRNFYTLAKDFAFPKWRSPLIRAVLRGVMGARYELLKRESFDDRYYNLAIATADQDIS